MDNNDNTDNIESIGKTSKSKSSKSKLSKSKTSKTKTSKTKLSQSKITDSHTVRFNNFVDYCEPKEIMSDNDSDNVLDSDNLSNNSSISDYVSDNASDNDLETYDMEQTDPTDIYDSDEEEINDDYENNLDELLCDEPLKDTIKYIYELFIQKHEQLNNYKNRHIILKMCVIAVNSMPEQKEKPIFYLNFIESSINHLKNLSVEKIKEINLSES